MTNRRKHSDDLRAANRLAVEATRAVTDLVEAMHQQIGAGPARLGKPLDAPVRTVTGLVYGGVRATTALVGAGVDLALAQLAPLLGERVPGREHQAILAALNGVLGDYLASTGNSLAIPMRMRSAGRPLELSRPGLRTGFPQAGPRLLVLVHGSSMNDLQWRRDGHDHGAALARELGHTPVYLHYNSGLHISDNGRQFDELLEQLVSQWPVPVEELAIVGHSMGGLVARAACHQADGRDRAWRRALRHLVCLGSPHHGAPLERGGNWIDLLLGGSRFSAPLARLGRVRSAGITDLRFGNVLAEHWQGRDRFAHAPDPRASLTLPAGVSCYTVAATLSPAPAGKLRGDGLVPVSSALGTHAAPALDLRFPEEHRRIVYGIGHFDLLGHAEVYQAVRAWLEGTGPCGAQPASIHQPGPGVSVGDPPRRLR